MVSNIGKQKEGSFNKNRRSNNNNNKHIHQVFF